MHMLNAFARIISLASDSQLKSAYLLHTVNAAFCKSPQQRASRDFADKFDVKVPHFFETSFRQDTKKGCGKNRNPYILAEREGFEPSKQV